MTNQYRFIRPPKAIRRRHVRLDNIVLFPGDMLPYKETWEKIAGNLPSGTRLIVLPPSQSRQRPIYEQVARRMRERGKAVRLVSPAELSHPI